MKKRYYSLLIALVLIAVYSYNLYTATQEKQKTISEAKAIKKNTKTSLLPSSTTGQVIHHEGYSLSYNEAHEQAEWVAYELKKEHLSNVNFKRPYFEIDKAIKTGAASWRNYKNSGYDKGHLCPAGDRKFSKNTHNETFLTSNISPQLHDFNAGVWNRLEQKTRYWAVKNQSVFVISGGVLNNSLKTIGKENVSVPNYFYKIVYKPDVKHPKMIGFLVPHKESNQPLYTFVVTVDSIEQLTGIDFFPELEDHLENKLEGSSSYKNWSF